MKRWTKDEEELLIDMVIARWVYKDIANELNRTVSSIEKKCVRLNISSNLKTTEQYKKELKTKCPNISCLEDYKGREVKILHKCLKCNKEYKSVPASKLQGYSCKYCGLDNNGGGIPLNKKGITYLVYIPKFDLYKIGITSRNIKIRMTDNKLKDSEYEIILEHTFRKGIDAMNLEKVWKENLKEYLVNTGKLKSGNTETFRL